MKSLIVSLLLLGSAQLMFSKRIVLVPMPNVSHTRYLTNVARALTALGHEAWVCMPESVARQNVFNTTGIHIVRYSSAEVNTVDDYQKYTRDAYWRDESADIKKLMEILFQHIVRMLDDEKLENAIRDISPDLMVIGNVPPMRMIAVMAYKLGIPFAFVGSLYDPVAHRVPFTSATFPSALFPYTDKMNFFQRLISFGICSGMVLFEIFSYTDAVLRFAPEKPYLPIRELTSRAEIVLVESDPILDYPKVALPNVKLIGGTAVSHAEPLQEPYKSFVEEAETDVVVVAFGSYILDLPIEIAAKLSAAFQRLGLRVVWRVNMTSPDPDKILTSTWIPQNDLLGHPKVKILVTHCGQSSQYEALYHGVPTLCMPMFTDQPYNAERARSKGYGLTLDIKKSTQDDIVSHIQELYTNATYTDNVQKASKLFRLLYGLPTEKAAFWLDHVLQHGGDHMRSVAQTLPGYQFYCLDILAFIFLVMVLVSMCLFHLSKKCVRSLNSFVIFIQLRSIRIKAKLS